MHRFVRGSAVASRRASTTPRLAKVSASGSVARRDSVVSNNINNMAFIMSRRANYSSTTQSMGADEKVKTESDAINENENNDSASAEATTEATAEDKVSSLEEELKQMKDQLLRGMAEQENVRRIAKKDVENARQYGITSFAKSMLDVADNLERAIEAVPSETREKLQQGEGDPMLAALLEGIIAVEKGLQKAFNSNGLKRFGDVGDSFDPEAYEALFQVPDDSKEENSISQVLKKGYKLQGRTLRAAQVGTTKKA